MAVRVKANHLESSAEVPDIDFTKHQVSKPWLPAKCTKPMLLKHKMGLSSRTSMTRTYLGPCKFVLDMRINHSVR